MAFKKNYHIQILCINSVKSTLLKSLKNMYFKLKHNRNIYTNYKMFNRNAGPIINVQGNLYQNSIVAEPNGSSQSYTVNVEKNDTGQKFD